MAPLTWRSVQLPNLGDPISALRYGDNSLQTGLAAFSEGLGRFDAWKTEQNDRTALAAASAIQDPMAYRDALTAGTALGGLAPTQVSARTLAALDSRAGALIARAADMDTLVNTRADRRGMDTNADLLTNLSTIATRGNPGELNEFLANNRDRLATLPASQIQGIIRGAQTSEGAAVTTAGNRIDNAARDFRLTTDRADRAATERSQPFIAELTRIAQSGNQAAIQTYIAANPEAVRDLPVGQIQRIIADAQSATRGARGNIEGEYNFNNQVDLDTDQRNARTFIERSIRDDFTVDQAREALERADLTPRSRALIRQELEGRYGGALYPTDASGAVGGASPARAAVAAAAGAGGRGGNPYDVRAGFRDTGPALTGMSLGEVNDDQREYVRLHGNSPMGAFQINRDTLADFGPRTFGPNWRNERFTPENQERLGRAIFEARKGGDLTGTWSALRNIPGADRPGFFANHTWEQMRGLISRAEVGQDVRNTAGTIRASEEFRQNVDIVRAQAQARMPLAREYLAGASNTADMPTVRDSLKTVFPGMSEGEIGAQLIRIRNQNPSMSWTQAGLVLRNSPRAGGGATWFGGSTPTRVNEQMADALTRQLASGDTQRAAQTQQDLEAHSAVLAQAQQRVENLAERYQRAVNSAGSNRERILAAEQLRAELLIAEQQLTQAMAQRQILLRDANIPGREDRRAVATNPFRAAQGQEAPVAQELGLGRARDNIFLDWLLNRRGGGPIRPN